MIQCNKNNFKHIRHDPIICFHVTQVKSPVEKWIKTLYAKLLKIRISKNWIKVAPDSIYQMTVSLLMQQCKYIVVHFVTTLADFRKEATWNIGIFDIRHSILFFFYYKRCACPCVVSEVRATWIFDKHTLNLLFYSSSHTKNIAITCVNQLDISVPLLHMSCKQTLDWKHIQCINQNSHVLLKTRNAFTLLYI